MFDEARVVIVSQLICSGWMLNLFVFVQYLWENLGIFQKGVERFMNANDQLASHS